MNTIFIQIASYRDPELLPTIRDCIARAKYPENLRFGIAWQHGEEESIDGIKEDSRFKIIDIPYFNSKGACWARNKIQDLYDGEKYTLQLDSHHRFVQDWDVIVIDMYESLKAKGFKPLLTSYISSYDPDDDRLENRAKEPWKMHFDKFTEDGSVSVLPAIMHDWKELSGPIPAHFYSAHFCFTSGEFCKEVPHDPELYFHGEEISITLRAYTKGYDLFHPHIIIAWHEYTRKGRVKHWDDFNNENRDQGKFEKAWWQLDMDSKKRLRHLLKLEDNETDLGIYGLGSVRSLADYENYSRISFKDRRLVV
jgi:hypothetical protein